ncbi:MAG: hypothetical protein WDM78_13840 [Puia sp.]
MQVTRPHGMVRKAGTVWPFLSRVGQPLDIQRGLPATRTICTAGNMEALIGDILVVCLYLPNGNPYPGPKFDYN